MYTGFLAWAYRHGVVIGLGLTFLGVVATAVPLFFIDRTEAHTDPATASSSTATSSADSAGESAEPSTSGPTSLVPSPPGDSPPGPGSCVNPSLGTALDCDNGSAALVVTSSGGCNPDALLSRWNLKPALDSLDLTLKEGDGICWVAPGPTARAAGATARDVSQASKGIVTSTLRRCASADGLIQLACSERHELEWIGGWTTASNSDDVVAICAQRAVEYTGMTIDGPDRLVAQVAGSVAGGQFRCSVKAESVVLLGSLRDLKGRPLPLA